MTDKEFEVLPAENIDWDEMGSDNRELLREWSRRKEQEFLDTATQCQHSNAICPVGRDRFFRTYWVFRSIAGLFVEEKGPEFPAASEPSGYLDNSRNNADDLPADTASSQPRWSVYGSTEDVDQLLQGLV